MQDMVASTLETRRLTYAAAAETRVVESQGKYEQRQRALEEARQQEAEARAKEEQKRELAKVCVFA